MIASITSAVRSRSSVWPPSGPAGSARGSPTEVQHTLFTLAPPTGSALQETLRAVQDDVFDAVMLACALVALVGALLACFLLRGPVPPPHSAAGLARRDS